MAASFKRVSAFSNVQQHGEISILHSTFILILFLHCLYCLYSFSVSINHLFCFYISVFQFSSICCLHVNISKFVVWDTTQDVHSEHNSLARSSWEISMYQIIFSKVSDPSFSSIYFSSNFTMASNTKFTD